MFVNILHENAIELNYVNYTQKLLKLEAVIGIIDQDIMGKKYFKDPKHYTILQFLDNSSILLQRKSIVILSSRWYCKYIFDNQVCVAYLFSKYSEHVGISEIEERLMNLM